MNNSINRFDPSGRFDIGFTLIGQFLVQTLRGLGYTLVFGAIASGIIGGLLYRSLGGSGLSGAYSFATGFLGLRFSYALGGISGLLKNFGLAFVDGAITLAVEAFTRYSANQDFPAKEATIYFLDGFTKSAFNNAFGDWVSEANPDGDWENSIAGGLLAVAGSVLKNILEDIERGNKGWKEMIGDAVLAASISFASKGLIDRAVDASLPRPLRGHAGDNFKLFFRKFFGTAIGTLVKSIENNF